MLSFGQLLFYEEAHEGEPSFNTEAQIRRQVLCFDSPDRYTNVVFDWEPELMERRTLD